MAFTQDSDGSSVGTPPHDSTDKRLQFKLESPDLDPFEYISDTDYSPDNDDSSVLSGDGAMDVEKDLDDNLAIEDASVSNDDDEEEININNDEDHVELQDCSLKINDSDTHNATRLGEIDSHAEANEYQSELRIYVNRCVFIRTTSIGKRVGFAPALPRTKTFYKCWTCDDWIPAGTSPICAPLCSNLHLTSKYVFERMIGLFCSWGCCKKYIHMCMTIAQRSKYMRSLHLLRKLFCPDIAYTPIENVESRTEMNTWGGPLTPQVYYSKIVKVNLRPLAEDICFWKVSHIERQGSTPAGEECPVAKN